MEKGLVHVYYGNGKGKTTASIGLIIRMLSYDKKILLIQFLKNGTSGEINYLKKDKNIDIKYQNNLNGFIYYLDEKEKQEVINYQKNLFNSILKEKNNYDCIVLDEVLDLISTNIIEEKELLHLIDEIDCELVLTGHYISADIIAKTNYYTEFIAHKHPYNENIKARKAIEY